MAWRRSLGIADDEPVIGFVGRLVMEKGLDVFSDSIDRLTASGVRHRVLVVGDGPAREWRSEEHTSELQSLMRISYAVFCLKKKKMTKTININYKSGVKMRTYTNKQILKNE